MLCCDLIWGELQLLGVDRLAVAICKSIIVLSGEVFNH